jgi:signal transduction histidine kinase/tetratricopeptide (TPR) repeat protein
MKKAYYVLVVLFYIFIVCFINTSAQDDTNKIKQLLISASEKTKSLPEIIAITDEAIKLSDNINYLQGKADALSIKGKTYLKIGDYSDALKAFWEELSLREKNPGWVNSSIGQTYNVIGESYRAVGNFDLALQYLEKSLKINEQKGETKELAYSYNRIAAVYHEIAMRKSDTSYSFKAEDFALKSIELNKTDTNLIVNSYNIMGAANIYRNNLDVGLKYLFLALDLMEKDSANLDIPNILNNISGTYNTKGDFRNAIKYALLSNELSKKSGIQVYILVSARTLGEVYSKIGDFENAYRYMREAHDVYLRLYDDKKTAEIYGLQKKHELELSEKEENIKTTKIIFVSVFLFLMGLMIAVAVIIRHRQLVTINKKLADKNKVISKQKEDLVLLNASKDKFFSILSHDIRNPLNGILGFSNILDSDFNEIADEEKKEYIGYIKTSSESLFKLIDRLLVWSRLQTHKIELKIEKINLKEIISNVVDLQKANAIGKGIVLESEINDESLYINGDKYMLDIVLRNLIDNAVKFTKAGGKVIIKSETKNKNVIFNVIDDGIGISKENLKNIFLVDQKILSKGTDKEEGTGLGLILCKEMLELMGTSLKIESEEGKGSRFFFELPCT